MGEIKSVKVDNWGVFFLQKLQNFFNKTDYCDLTLQFRDNSQLKVHRLVLSACTDYFNVLEQNCDMVDDALIMPNELQADVVVPIVNFMYTGTLEFELKMYGRLLRTAKEMNMTVLLKLLEAHRRTMEGVNKAHRPPSPKAIRRRGPVANAGNAMSQQLQQQRRVLTTNNGPQQRRGVQVTNTMNQQGQQIRQQIGSTAVTRTAAVKQESRDFESHGQQQATSPFEQLRRGYKNNKRPTSTTVISPPAKKPNIEDVKEFAEQQRMRKQIAAEYGEDLEYEGVLDDDIHADDDDDEAAGPSAEQKNQSLSDSYTSPVKQRQQQQQTQAQQSQQVHEQATITIKQGVGDEPATIIVKEASNTKMNHTKIISEVLRQYPHLVKGSKNIKLKIMPSTAGQPQKIIVKKEATVKPANVAASTTASAAAQRVTQHQKTQLSHANVKQLQTKHADEKPQSNNEQVATSIQKRRIDSKTMHALIAMGAENTTGPWLCLRCGVNGRPISIPSYRSFRRHLVNTHKEVIDQALCEHCGWRSNTNRELHFHIEQEHKMKSTDYAFPECLICAEAYIDSNALNEHMEENHVDEQKQQCIYCNKIFVKELQLYQHMKSYHKKQAIEDGIIDYEDEEYLEEALTQKEKEKSAAKVKILSDISLPGATVKMEQTSSEADALSAVASGIATSIAVDSGETADAEFIQAVTDDNGVETKFINADGNEMVLTAEQRKEIMSQLNQENVGGTVMVLQDDESAVAAAAEAAKLEQNAHAMEEEYDDSQIYNELASSTVLMQDTQSEETGKQDSIDWAQNLISPHEMEEQTEKPKVEKDDLSQKLKELTGDWTDEEDDVVDDAFEQNAEQAQEEAAVLPKLEKEEDESKEEATAEAEAGSCSSDVDDIDMTLKGLHEEDPAKESAEIAGINDEFSTHDIAAEQKSAEEEELVEKEDKPLDQDVEPEEIKDEEVKEENLNESLDDEKAGSTLLDELIAEADVNEKPRTSIKAETDDENEQEVEAAKQITEQDIVDTSDVAENKDLNQENAEDDVSMKELQSPTSDAKRAEETVKSLISAWDDDDDDEEETNENQVSKMDVDVEKSEISNVINKEIDEDENALSNKDDTDL